MSVAEQFAAEGAIELDDDGVVRHAVVEFELDEAALISIRQLGTDSPRPQALVLDSDHKMTAAGTSATRLRIWSDSSPEVVTIEAPAGRLTVWNEWSHNGTVHAWLGNAHLRVEGERPIVLTAVDGLGDPGDAHLVLELRFGLALATD